MIPGPATASSLTYSHIGVVIPAHNERAQLPRCLRAVLTAGATAPVPVTIVVVLDSCDDDSAQLAGQFGPDVHFVTVEVGNVGAARAAGFTHLRTLCVGPGWYATTDADSQVDPDWLIRQLNAGTDMVLGVVRVANWRTVPAATIQRYLRNYNARVGRTHDHVHGANMGFDSDAYWQLGGFHELPTGEDVELVARFDDAGYRIRRDPRLSVVTSARTEGRAPNGFAGHLRDLKRSRKRSAAKESA